MTSRKALSADWIKGQPYTAFCLGLPKNCEIYIRIAQHESGKVTVRQAVSQLVGSFDCKNMRLNLGSCDKLAMDFLNKVLILEVKA